MIHRFEIVVGERDLDSHAESQSRREEGGCL